MPSAFVKRKEISPRNIIIGEPDASFARNVTRNQKYHAATFLPQVVVEQFKTFSNLYFLLVALSQLIPALKVPVPCNISSFSFLIPCAQVGFLFTYVAPLVFVLAITIVKEGYDDFQRYQRDAAGTLLQGQGCVLQGADKLHAVANSQMYRVLSPDGSVKHLPSGRLQVLHTHGCSPPSISSEF
jgi:hypothetical protein